MPWIEGIGDEVTIGVSFLLGLFVLFVAWLSTGIRDIPFISVIIVQLTRRARVQTENGDANANTADNQASVESQSEENADQTETTPSTNETIDNLNQEIDGRTDNERDEVGVTSEPVASGSNSNSRVDITEVDNVEKQIDSKTEKTAEIADETEQLTETIEADGSDIEPEVCPVSNTELRERRVQFYSNQTSENVPTDTETLNHSEEKRPESDAINTETKPPSDAKPKSLSKLASEFLSEQLPTNTSLSDDSVTVNRNSSERAGTSDNRDSNGQTGSQSQTGSSNLQDDSGLEPGEIRVRIKFLNDTQRLVTSLATETIGNFRRRHFPTELSQSKLVRFIFNGQDLRNDASTLQSYNIGDNSVLHCLVTQPPPEQHSHNHGDDDGLDIGIFMFPLFGLLLGIVWYMRFMYRQFFNVTSTLTLSGITFLYLAAFMSSLRGNRNHEHID